MHIHFTCSGGYANLQLTYAADTANLPPDLAEELSLLVTTSRIWELSDADFPAPIAIPDIIAYELTVQEGDRQVTRSLNDITAPATFQPLLTKLRDLAFAART
jgi:hypothetical protein